MMSGEMWVDSDTGRGSTFHFTAEFGFEGQTLPVSQNSVLQRLRIWWWMTTRPTAASWRNPLRTRFAPPDPGKQWQCARDIEFSDLPRIFFR